MTNEQLIIFLDTLANELAGASHELTKKMDANGIDSSKYFRLIIHGETRISDMIDKLQPAIKLCKCGKKMSGIQKKCAVCSGLFERIQKRLLSLKEK